MGSLAGALGWCWVSGLLAELPDCKRGRYSIVILGRDLGHGILVGRYAATLADCVTQILDQYGGTKGVPLRGKSKTGLVASVVPRTQYGPL